jgi:hypothetical protein
MYSVHNGDDAMSLKRWVPTFLAFPLGGLLAIETVGSRADVAGAAAGGLVAGAIIGAAQWLALRPDGIGARWVAFTAAAMAAGTALAATVTGTGTELADLMLNGAISGAAVGAAQSALLGQTAARRAAWIATTAVAWPLGWLATWAVIVDADRGHHVFGSSGALFVTLLTGLALRRLLGPPASAPDPAPAA